jgi:hypothetical protein
MRYQIITTQMNEPDSPTEPVTVEDVKLYLQVEGNAYNAMFAAFIRASRRMVEQYTGVSLLERTALLVVQTCEGDVQVPIPYRPFADVDSLEPDVVAELTQGERTVVTLPLPDTYTMVYNLNASNDPALLQAVIMQAGYMFTHRDNKDAGISPAAKIIMDFYTLPL